MKPETEFASFRSGIKKILRADPKIVKAAMEQEKKEREEERKAGSKVRGRKAKTALILLLPFLMLATARAADKHPERKAHRYAQQFAAEIEHDGWSVTTFAMRPGCPFLCLNHGEHDCLRIFMTGATVEDVDRSALQEMKPRIPEMRSLGFVEIDLLGLQSSHNYPDGIARIPFPPEA